MSGSIELDGEDYSDMCAELATLRTQLAAAQSDAARFMQWMIENEPEAIKRFERQARALLAPNASPKGAAPGQADEDRWQPTSPAGWYWAQLQVPRGWHPMHWDGRIWTFDAGGIDDGAPEEIGPRIPEPPKGAETPAQREG